MLAIRLTRIRPQKSVINPIAAIDLERYVVKGARGRRKILKVVKRSALRKARSVASFDGAQLVLRKQRSLYAKTDIIFPLHGNGDYAGAQSGTNVKWPAREWRELGSRDIDHRTRGARVRAREAIESSLSEVTRPHSFMRS